MKLRSRIVLFTLAILVPAMLTGTWLLFQSLEREQVAAQARVGEITRALSRVVDREIDRRAAIAEVLASSPAFQAWDLPAFCWLAKSSLHDDLGPVAVRDRDHLLLSTTEPDCLVQYSPAHINSKNFSMQAVQLSELFQWRRVVVATTDPHPAASGGAKFPILYACGRAAEFPWGMDCSSAGRRQHRSHASPSGNRRPGVPASAPWVPCS